MELVVLSTLEWRMNPVTPLSFVDHIGRRMATTTNTPLHWDEFQRTCHSTLLSLIVGKKNQTEKPQTETESTLKSNLLLCLSICPFVVLFQSDSRWSEYLPSVLAAATMIYVLEKLQLLPGSSNQILSLLNITKEDADGCYQFLVKYLSND